MKYFNLAIDGPAGAGKSTIAKRVAKELGFVYIDTGAMYRAMAFYFLQNNIQASDVEGIEKACPNVNVTIEYRDGEQQVILNGENVSGLLRTEEVGNMASASSVNKAVRLKLVELQQNLAAKENVVMDGRDIGSFVLPNADLKIYLTASSKERARRRWAELKQKGEAADLEAIELDIIERDNRDMTREFAPLVQAEDAIYLDSSDLTIDQVVEEILGLYEKVR
ncbi:MAG: (d)CMP kinase [Mobilitalea sp.]